MSASVVPFCAQKIFCNHFCACRFSNQCARRLTTPQGVDVLIEGIRVDTMARYRVARDAGQQCDAVAA